MSFTVWDVKTRAYETFVERHGIARNREQIKGDRRAGRIEATREQHRCHRRRVDT
jgi:hypothetical protein